MTRSTPTTQDIVAAIGLEIGGALGLAGIFAVSPELRTTLWMIDDVALTVASALLALRFFRLGNDCVAAGFLTFMAGSCVMLAGNAAGLHGGVPSFAGGIALWAAALLTISVPATFRMWARMTAAVAAALFAVSAGQIVWGIPLLPTTAPLPAIGFPVLVLTFAGWIWTILQPAPVPNAQPAAQPQAV
jgi:hypothetical protein